LVELQHAIDILKLDGIGLLTNYRGTYLGDPSFAPLMREIERRAVPVFVHPATPPSKDQPTFGLPPSLYEYTFDTTRAVVNLLYSRTVEKHPQLRMIFSHGGGAVPYVAKRLTYGPVINSRLSERAPADVIAALRSLYYDLALATSDYALPSLQALLDPSHILFGSDFPFMPEWHMEESVAKLDNYKGFGETERDLIRWGNARNLFPRLAGAMAA
jgi:predicted TIM-barrel fold metal-dependent hydrolase